MSRPLRLEFHGAIYHVTSRGNAREAIFVDDEDKGIVSCRAGGNDCTLWLALPCLLPDGHLLIETLDGNLSLGTRQRSRSGKEGA